MNLSFTFAHLQVLWGLLAVPALVIVFALDGQLRGRVVERIGHLPQVRRMLESVSDGRRRIKSVLVVAAVGCLVVALAGPQLPGNAHVAPQRGLDLVVCLDFSKSMLASDVYPSRLDRARAELNRLIDGLKGDRVGLVAFAGVTLAYPMTTDYGAAKLFWRDLSPTDIPVGGTDLGGALREAMVLLAGGGAGGGAVKSPEAPVARHKAAQVIVLLTDGDDTEGTAQEMAREAAKKGIKVFAVGIGSPRGELVTLARHPDGTAEYLTDEAGTPVRMVLDVATLKQIATATGGDFFQVDPERFGVERVARAIADLERVEEEARVVKEPEDVAGWLIIAGIALLMLEILIRESRRRRPRAAGSVASSSVASSVASASSSSSVAPLVLLLLALPGLTGFRFFERNSPDVEEGNKLLAAGKAKEAIAAYDRALAQYPDDAAIHFDRGAALYAAGQLPEAQREFQRAAADPDPSLRADATYNLGNTFLSQEKMKEAVEAYKRVLAVRPSDRQARWNLEMALRKLKEEQQKKQPSQGDSKDKQDKQDQQDKQAQEDKNQQQQKDAQQDKQGKPDKQDGSSTADTAKAQEKQAQDKAAAEKQDKQAQQDKQGKDQKSQEAREAEAGADKGKAAQAAAGRPPRDTERQDAEAVLDAFEAVEPTVQKDLARQRAGNRRPRKDW